MLLLQRLGVWENFIKEGHLSSPGIVSAWESDQPYEKDFIFTPYGNEPLSVWRYFEIEDSRTLPLVLAGGVEIPHDYVPIHASRNKGLSIRCPSGRSNGFRMGC